MSEVIQRRAPEAATSARQSLTVIPRKRESSILGVSAFLSRLLQAGQRADRALIRHFDLGGSVHLPWIRTLRQVVPLRRLCKASRGMTKAQCGPSAIHGVDLRPGGCMKINLRRAVGTDDDAEYPADRLQQIKSDHERRFSRPDRAILERLTDWTTTVQPTRVQNLRRINQVLQWNQTDSELVHGIDELNEYIDRFQTVPIEVRRFLGEVAKRIVRVRGTSVVEEKMRGTNILITDIRDAFQLSDRTLGERVTQLDAYRLGDLDEISSDFGGQPAICIYALKSGWPLWIDVVAFCEAASISLESFTEDLDFSQFDT